MYPVRLLLDLLPLVLVELGRVLGTRGVAPVISVDRGFEGPEDGGAQAAV